MSDGKLNGGVNPYRGGRKSGLEDPERVRLAAAMYAEGWTRKAMAEELGVSEWTVTQWRKDPRVRAQVKKLTEDRILRITGRIDHIIAGRLQEAEDMDTELLLKIRKEFLGGAFRAQAEGAEADDTTINKTMAALEDTNLAQGLKDLLSSLETAKVEDVALPSDDE